MQTTKGQPTGHRDPETLGQLIGAQVISINSQRRMKPVSRVDFRLVGAGY
jgi:hypothetical protein